MNKARRTTVLMLSAALLAMLSAPLVSCSGSSSDEQTAETHSDWDEVFWDEDDWE